MNGANVVSAGARVVDADALRAMVEATIRHEVQVALPPGAQMQKDEALDAVASVFAGLGADRKKLRAAILKASAGAGELQAELVLARERMERNHPPERAQELKFNAALGAIQEHALSRLQRAYPDRTFTFSSHFGLIKHILLGNPKPGLWNKGKRLFDKHDNRIVTLTQPVQGKGEYRVEVSCKVPELNLKALFEDIAREANRLGSECPSYEDGRAYPLRMTVEVSSKF